MIGDKLRVQQAIAAHLEPGDQMHQRDFGSIARAVKHAFAEKCAAKADPVKTADQAFAVVNLHGVTVAAFVELAIESADAAVDPGAASPRLWLRAAFDHRVKVPVNDYREGCGTDCARQATGKVKSIQRYDAATLGLDPIERRIIGALRHGKYPAGVSLQQHLRRDVDERGLAACHGFV